MARTKRLRTLTTSTVPLECTSQSYHSTSALLPASTAAPLPPPTSAPSSSQSGHKSARISTDDAEVTLISNWLRKATSIGPLEAASQSYHSSSAPPQPHPPATTSAPSSSQSGLILQGASQTRLPVPTSAPSSSQTGSPLQSALQSYHSTSAPLPAPTFAPSSSQSGFLPQGASQTPVPAPMATSAPSSSQIGSMARRKRLRDLTTSTVPLQSASQSYHSTSALPPPPAPPSISSPSSSKSGLPLQHASKSYHSTSTLPPAAPFPARAPASAPSSSKSGLPLQHASKSFHPTSTLPSASPFPARAPVSAPSSSQSVPRQGATKSYHSTSALPPAPTSAPSSSQSDHKSARVWIVDVIDEQGIIKKAHLKVQDVWMLPLGQRVVVYFNTKGQPTGEASDLLGGFLRLLGTNFSAFPINYHSWDVVPDNYKETCYNITVKARFCLGNMNARRFVYEELGKTWKSNQYRSFERFYRPELTREDNIRARPRNVPQDTWRAFIDYRSG